MVSLSTIGFIAGSLAFAFGFLHDPRRPGWILFGIFILFLSMYGAGVF